MERKKRLAWLALAAGATAVAAIFAPALAPAPQSAPASASPRSTIASAAQEPLTALPARETIGKSRGEVFVAGPGE
ncbi:MAG: hypothetical protein ABI423_12325, partial [Burkholderiales bacterium]